MYTTRVTCAAPGKYDAAALSGQPRTALIEQPLEARLQPKPGASAAAHAHPPGEECEGEMSREELLKASANLANVVNHSDFARLKDAYAFDLPYLHNTIQVIVVWGVYSI